MRLNILIVNTEDSFREELAEMLRAKGHICNTVSDGNMAVPVALEKQPDVILCDLIMPIKNGIELLHEISPCLPQTKIIMVTAYGTIETAIQALHQGAYDYILKPVELSVLSQQLEAINEKKALIEEVKNLRRQISHGEDPQKELIGKSKVIKDLNAQIDMISETRTKILIRGETGTGKELVARAIHNRTFPPGKPFVAINCACIPESLLEAELFGYEKGSFTGAIRDKPGLLEIASDTTLFMDEIGEMPLLLQTKLLRVIDEQKVQRLGSTEPISINPRIIAATNSNLEEMVKEKKFRQDLYYRLCVGEIFLPPLRERREDIPMLAEHFVSLFNREMKRSINGITNATLQRFMIYPWPGNVRELKNTIERAMLFQKTGSLEISQLGREAVWEVKDIPDNLQQASRTYEKAHIHYILNKVKGNRSKAAELLGIDRSTLYRKLSQE